MASSGVDRQDDENFQTRRVDNQHHDEELLVVDAENVPSRASYYDNAAGAPGSVSVSIAVPSGRGGSHHQQEQQLLLQQQQLEDRQRKMGEVEQPYSGVSNDDDADVGLTSRPSRPMNYANGAALDGYQDQMVPGQDEADGIAATQNSEEHGESDELDEGSDEEQGDHVGLYDPMEFDNLPVGVEIKDLFKHITQYKPINVELMTKLRPFIPEYMPAVGDIDGFLKVERPDGQPEMLGLTVLDEPCARQSDPSVLDIQLRRMTKEKKAKEATVHSIPEGAKNPREIDNWMANISELHRQKPPANVNYTSPMPDIEGLMRQWPADFEETLKSLPLPSADLDCDLKTYVDIGLGITDIPVGKSRIEALHVLFTLYSEVNNSQHSHQLAGAEPDGGRATERT